MEVLIIPPLVLLFLMLPVLLGASIQAGSLLKRYEDQSPFVQTLMWISGAIVIWLLIGVTYYGIWSLIRTHP